MQTTYFLLAQLQTATALAKDTHLKVEFISHNLMLNEELQIGKPIELNLQTQLHKLEGDVDVEDLGMENIPFSL